MDTIYIANIVTCNKPRVHYLKLVRKLQKQLGLAKHGRRPAVAKKKVFYCILFQCYVIALQNLGANDQRGNRSVILRFYS